MFHSFIKEIEKDIKQKVFYLEGSIDIDADYFINEIEKGIVNSKNNHLTNIKGFMTSWEYFLNDQKFNEVFINIINNVEYHASVDTEILKHPWGLKECWGIKETKGNYTAKHEHLPSIVSGVLYLNSSKQELIFDQINVRLKPEKGKFAIFSSLLEHYTERNLEDTPKYAISFNLNQISPF